MGWLSGDDRLQVGIISCNLLLFKAPADFTDFIEIAETGLRRLGAER